MSKLSANLLLLLAAALWGFGNVPQKAVLEQLDSIARAAGRPWRRIEKDAARAALALLP